VIHLGNRLMPRRVLLLSGLLGLAALSVLTAAPPPPTGRSVLLGTGLNDEQVIVLSATVAASDYHGTLLLDAPGYRRSIRGFLSRYRPDRITPVGVLEDEDDGGLRQELGGWVGAPLEWRKGQPEALWKMLFPRAGEVVVCPPTPRSLLLQSACLAGTVHAPLYVLHSEAEAADLRRRLTAWGTHKVYAVGKSADVIRGLPKIGALFLPDEEAVASYRLERQLQKGPVQTLVVTNPAERFMGPFGMSSLAAWVALKRGAPLLFTGPRGDDASTILRAAVKNPTLRRAENLVLVGDRRTILPERHKNPLPGADPIIEVEPPGPPKGEPFSFATGRLFHRQPGIVMLMLAREDLLPAEPGPRRALVVSNPDGGLPLLETISHNTAEELRNAGYQTDALFARASSRLRVRQLLPQADIFLWEGHYGTLIGGYGVPRWPEPLRPSLVFLQSCLALNEPCAQPFLEHGALGVIGSPARTYSATGGAITLAYFDALLYDGESVGGSLRQAKNFLLAYARLKEQRLGKASKLGGANVRSAWAFTLWGDPTLKLPRPTSPKASRPIVRTEVLGGSIVMSLPSERYPKVTTNKYQVMVWPNGRLGGLVTKEDQDPRKALVPLVFAEVHLKGRGTPRLTSRIPADYWVFLWDSRLHTGYLLVRPRRRDQEQLRFFVNWE
jgi:hypothetical protein